MELINGRTAEEIKHSLEWSAFTCVDTGCDECKFAKDCSSMKPGYEIARDALAMIERLEAAVPRWISVEERLPRCGERVLITNEGAVWEAYLSISHKWVRQEFVWAYKVTHWMPLPEPPKEGAHDAEKSV